MIHGLNVIKKRKYSWLTGSVAVLGKRGIVRFCNENIGYMTELKFFAFIAEPDV